MISGFLRPVGTLTYGFEYAKSHENEEKQETLSNNNIVENRDLTSLGISTFGNLKLTFSIDKVRKFEK